MPRELVLTSKLKTSAHEVRHWVMRPALFLHVAAPLIHFSPIGIDRFPDVWSEGEYRGSMKLFGAIPIGWQAIGVELSSSDGAAVMRDKGYGPLLRVWEHTIEVAPNGSGSIYTDRLHLDAGWLTPIAAIFVKQFFKHRHRRMKALDQAGFASLKA